MMKGTWVFLMAPMMSFSCYSQNQLKLAVPHYPPYTLHELRG